MKFKRFETFLIIIVVVSAIAMIVAQSVLGSLPPILFYVLFGLLAGGRMMMEFIEIYKDYKTAAAKGQARLHITVTGITVIVIAIVGYFFITS